MKNAKLSPLKLAARKAAREAIASEARRLGKTENVMDTSVDSTPRGRRAGSSEQVSSSGAGVMLEEEEKKDAPSLLKIPPNRGKVSAVLSGISRRRDAASGMLPLHEFARLLTRLVGAKSEIESERADVRALAAMKGDALVDAVTHVADKEVRLRIRVDVVAHMTDKEVKVGLGLGWMQ